VLAWLPCVHAWLQKLKPDECVFPVRAWLQKLKPPAYFLLHVVLFSCQTIFFLDTATQSCSPLASAVPTRPHTTALCRCRVGAMHRSPRAEEAPVHLSTPPPTDHGPHTYLQAVDDHVKYASSNSPLLLGRPDRKGSKLLSSLCVSDAMSICVE